MSRPSRLTRRGDLEVVLIASRAGGGRGSGGTRGAGRAGSPCESVTACRRTALFAYGKTVWSWPSLLRSSLSRRCARAQPGGRHQIRGAREARRKVRLPGERGISRPTIAQGRPSDRHHLYAAVRFFLRVHFAQRTAGASWHPAFPAPSWIKRGARPTKARVYQAARLRRRVCGLSCVPQTRSRKGATWGDSLARLPSLSAKPGARLAM